MALRSSYIVELAKYCDCIANSNSHYMTLGSCFLDTQGCTVYGISQHQQYDETLLYQGPMSSLRSRRIWLCSCNMILSSLNHMNPADWLWFRANHFACFFISNLLFFNMVKIQDKISIGLNSIPLSLNTFSPFV